MKILNAESIVFDEVEFDERAKRVMNDVEILFSNNGEPTKKLRYNEDSCDDKFIGRG